MLQPRQLDFYVSIFSTKFATTLRRNDCRVQEWAVLWPRVQNNGAAASPADSLVHKVVWATGHVSAAPHGVRHRLTLTFTAGANQSDTLS
jgi:hypothetical protein